MRGSVRKRKGSKCSWTIRFDLDREDGKRKQFSIAFRGTKKAAEKRLADLRGSNDRGEFVEPSSLTLSEWLPGWLEGHAKATVKAATYVRYSGVIRNHVLKAPIAKIPLQKLRESHLETYYAGLPIGSRPVHHTVLRSALRRASKGKLIVANPAADMDHAPRRAKSKNDDARVNCWTKADAQAFLVVAIADGPQTAAFYAVALDSGARKNELCGLGWKDVDLAARSIRIVRQLTKGGSTPEFGTPKGGREREVTLSDETIELLRRHKTAQAKLKMANRTIYQDHGLVFAKETRYRGKDFLGLPVQSNNLGERQLDKLIAIAKVPRVTVHGLRHTCATLLLQALQPIHVVSQRLGHASVKETMDTYAHVLPDKHRQAAATMGSILHG